MTLIKCCGNCEYSETLFPELEPEDDDIYFCNWSGPVPHSWRYARREVVSVEFNEGTDCKCFKENKK
jgi:hypothetical protein